MNIITPDQLILWGMPPERKEAYLALQSRLVECLSTSLAMEETMQRARGNIEMASKELEKSKKRALLRAFYPRYVKQNGESIRSLPRHIRYQLPDLMRYGDQMEDEDIRSKRAEVKVARELFTLFKEERDQLSSEEASIRLDLKIIRSVSQVKLYTAGSRFIFCIGCAIGMISLANALYETKLLST